MILLTVASDSNIQLIYALDREIKDLTSNESTESTSTRKRKANGSIFVAYPYLTKYTDYLTLSQR